MRLRSTEGPGLPAEETYRSVRDHRTVMAELRTPVIVQQPGLDMIRHRTRRPAPPPGPQKDRASP
ncbi:MULTISPECIES: hypothetical protein [Streptomyces]|uniref:hypothetical protein n=1 Tax=Streptomyces TaxID=1883 RepID=UPI00117C1A82|nr:MULTISPECIES: hypothetical protein [unclassified Streptomyces]WTE30964.1 hypothetical protein OHB50_37460 [Streptomyces anulatus]